MHYNIHVMNPFTNKSTKYGVDAYPYDTISELRKKIFYVTKIPIYRQHLYYKVNNINVYPYRVIYNDEHHKIDWNVAIHGTNKLCGIGIQIELEKYKKSFYVESKEDTILCNNIPDFYIVDLYSILNVQETIYILQDDYQSGLLYYGAIILFWPIISSEEIFHNVIMDNWKILDTIYQPTDKILDTIETEKQINSTLPTSTKKTEAAIYISYINIKVDSKYASTKLSLRNVIDLLSTSSSILAVKYGNIKKRHLCSYYSHHKSNVDAFIEKATVPDVLNLLLVRSVVDAIVRYIYISIYVDGSYYIKCEFSEGERHLFNSFLPAITLVINPVLIKLNNMGHNVFITGGELQLLNDTTAYSGKVNSYFFINKMLSNKQFVSAVKFISIYEQAGILKIKTFHAGIINLLFLKSRYLPHQFGGKLSNPNMITITLRSSDIKVNFNEIDKLSILTLLTAYINDIFSTFKSLSKSEDSKVLSILQEKDPVLFNIKNIDAKLKPYSVLCQSKRQPSIVEESEITNLSKSQKNRLVKYWNFTENRPVYYLCNDSLYKYVVFKKDIHPLGYCLPCCRQNKTVEGSQTEAINKLCINKIDTRKSKSKSVYDIDNIIASNIHELAYGKLIPYGRIGRPHSVITDALEYGYKNGYGLHMIGVPQNVKSLTNCGLAFSMAYIVGRGNMKEAFNNVIEAMAHIYKDNYVHLGYGAAKEFNSLDELITVIQDTFIYEHNSTTVFSEGGLLSAAWKDILIELFTIATSVHFIFIDIDNGIIDINLPSSTLSKLLAEDDIAIGVIVNAPCGSYPLAILQADKYLRLSLNAKKTRQRLQFFKHDEFPMYDNIRKICITNNALKTQIGYTVTKFVNDSKKWSIKNMFLNMHAVFYCILINDTANNHVAIPVNTTFIPKVSNQVFDLRPRELSYKREVLLEFIAEFNEYCEQQIINQTKQILYNGNIIGFLDQHNLAYYHDPIPPTDVMNTITFYYDPYLIDLAISYGSVRDTEIDTLASRAKCKNNLYKLFAIEFFRNEKSELKQKVKMIVSANYRNLQALEENLTGVITPLETSILLRIVHKANKKDKDISFIESAVNSMYFIKEMSKDEAVNYVKSVLADRLEVIDTNTCNVEIGNILVSCVDNSKGKYCKDSKLLLPSYLLDEFIDLLADGISNNSQKYMLQSILDKDVFIEHPGEVYVN